MTAAYPPLGDLGLIGNRRTAAAIGKDATVYWYSPYRFDHPSIFSGLLDPAKGMWRISLPGSAPGHRRYIANSAVLETQLTVDGGRLVVTDWMTMSAAARPGLLCRNLSPAPDDTTVIFDAWHGNGRRRAIPAIVDGAAVFEDGLHLFASHPLELDERGISWVLPKGEEGWTALADGPCDRPDAQKLAAWRDATIGGWNKLAALTTFDGPYRAEVAASLRQLRLLVFEPTGAIAASATVGLPEVIGGKRNYDYRYSWLRDTAMIVRALLRTEQRASEGERFLQFIALSRDRADRKPLNAVVTVDGRPVPEEDNPPLVGYEASRPVRIGNRAGQQLQLGALGNFLLAAGLIYREHGGTQHWDVVGAVADFLASHWRQPDSGMWESPERRQYTASKVFAACGLEAVAPFAPAARRKRYAEAAHAIRRYVMRHCLTPDGAFATFEGCRGVDVSAALYPVWDFCPPDSPAMEATMRALHRDYERDGLFKREDKTPEHQFEGAFLPGSFWVAQYWATRGDQQRARFYIDAGLAHANDLGILPEEVDWRTRRALGNLPLGMAHASFLNAAVDLCRSPAHA